MIARPNPDRYTRATLTVDDALWHLLNAVSVPRAPLTDDCMCAARAQCSIDDYFAWRRLRARSLTLGLRLRRKVVVRRDELDLIERLRPHAVEWSMPKRWEDAHATIALRWFRRDFVAIDHGHCVEILAPEAYAARAEGGQAAYKPNNDGGLRPVTKKSHRGEKNRSKGLNHA